MHTPGSLRDLTYLVCNSPAKVTVNVLRCKLDNIIITTEEVVLAKELCETAEKLLIVRDKLCSYYKEKIPK